MGFYITCSICGIEQKVPIYCFCSKINDEKNASKMLGAKILDSFIFNDNDMLIYLIQKFKKDDKIFYMQTNIYQFDYNDSNQSKINKITRTCYKELKMLKP